MQSIYIWDAMLMAMGDSCRSSTPSRRMRMGFVRLLASMLGTSLRERSIVSLSDAILPGDKLTIHRYRMLGECLEISGWLLLT